MTILPHESPPHEVRTGDERIDSVLDRIAASIRALEPRMDDLLDHERATLAQVMGDYLPELLAEYRRMPQRWRDAETPDGGSPRDALVEAVAMMAALLRTAEERLIRVGASRILCGREAMAERVRYVTARSDVPPVVLVPKDPPVPAQWPHQVKVGAVVVAIVLFVVGAITWAAAALMRMDQARQAAASSSSGGLGAGGAVFLVLLVVGVIFCMVSGGRR